MRNREMVSRENVFHKDDKYRLLGDDIVLWGDFIYNYDDDCWRCAPDVFSEYVIDRPATEEIEEEQARKIVKENGGKNFDSRDEILVVTEGNQIVGL